MSQRDPARLRYYIGLATTFHDPALAIVGPEGAILFAEATERRLQDKRAVNQPAEPFVSMRDTLTRFCDPDAELVVATTWSLPFSLFLGLGAVSQQFTVPLLKFRSALLHRSLMPDFELMTYASMIHMAQRRAGLGVLFGAFEAFGHRRVRVERYQHHLTHAVHGCLTSPFDDAICAVVDGLGEFGSFALYHYRSGRLRRLQRHIGWESLGFFYSLLTDLCGFRSQNEEQWKVMGLASFGERDSELECLLRRLCHAEYGRLVVPSRHEVQRVVAVIRRKIGEVAGQPLRAANLAKAGQTVFGENMTALLRPFAELGLSENLVLTGGCALNSAYNGRVLEETGFRRLYVPAAPGDDGNAIGAALLAQRRRSGDRPWRPGAHGELYPYVGSELSRETLRRVESVGMPGRARRVSHGLADEVARHLAQGRVVGWLQGRAEFGPRALGNRSILADPRNPGIKDRLNREVKFREDFRPFAPAILHERGPEYFERYEFSPYMERALCFRKAAAARVPAVVHVDGTGRLQSVTRRDNPRFHAVIEAFEARTGVPVLLNTSFNAMHKPIVHAVEDALGLFLSSGLDVLVLDDLVIEKPTPCVPNATHGPAT
jgi:carbamoyltransferase